MNLTAGTRFVGACVLSITTWVAVAQTEQSAPASAATDAPKPNKRPPRPDRVYVKDVEGVWMTQKYMAALQATHSPRHAARQAQPIVIQVKKDNGVYPILTTNFQGAVLQFLIEVEPDKRPHSWRLVTAKSEGIINAADVTYTYFTGKRGQGGAFESLALKETNFAKGRVTNFARLTDPLETFINKHTVAGKYKDDRGKAYEFGVEGDATLPDRKFAYEVPLDTTQANCDVMTSHHEKEPEGKEHIGFALKDNKLALYNVDVSVKGKWRCEAQPFVTLTRGEST